MWNYDARSEGYIFSYHSPTEAKEVVTLSSIGSTDLPTALHHAVLNGSLDAAEELARAKAPLYVQK